MPRTWRLSSERQEKMRKIAEEPLWLSLIGSTEGKVELDPILSPGQGVKVLMGMRGMLAVLVVRHEHANVLIR